MTSNLLKLMSDADQDRAALETWWRSHTDEDKLRVWMAIQAEYPNPVMEIVSRFAQVAFTETTMRLDGGAA